MFLSADDAWAELLVETGFVGLLIIFFFFYSGCRRVEGIQEYSEGPRSIFVLSFS